MVLGDREEQKMKSYIKIIQIADKKVDQLMKEPEVALQKNVIETIQIIVNIAGKVDKGQNVCSVEERKNIGVKMLHCLNNLMEPSLESMNKFGKLNIVDVIETYARIKKEFNLSIDESKIENHEKLIDIAIKKIEDLMQIDLKCALEMGVIEIMIFLVFVIINTGDIECLKTKEIAKKMVEHLDDLISPSFETTNGIGDIYTPWCLYAYKVWKDML